MEENDNVVGLQLITGQVVIARVRGLARKSDEPTSPRCDGYVVDYPLVLAANVTTVRKDAKIDIQFAPFMPYSKNTDAVIDNAHILFEFIPQDDLVEFYKKTVSKAESKILIPDKKLLLG